MPGANNGGGSGSSYETFEISDFTFASGAKQSVKIAYQSINPTSTKGTVLIPTCFGGRINTTLTFTTGALREYHVVVVAMLGNGESSSPSNDETFPRDYTLRYQVRFLFFFFLSKHFIRLLSYHFVQASVFFPFIIKGGKERKKERKKKVCERLLLSLKKKYHHTTLGQHQCPIYPSHPPSRRPEPRSSRRFLHGWTTSLLLGSHARLRQQSQLESTFPQTRHRHLRQRKNFRPQLRFPRRSDVCITRESRLRSRAFES